MSYFFPHAERLLSWVRRMHEDTSRREIFNLSGSLSSEVPLRLNPLPRALLKEDPSRGGPAVLFSGFGGNEVTILTELRERRWCTHFLAPPPL